MPSVSGRQHRFMEMVAHSPGFARKVGVPQSVGQDFSEADRGHHYRHSNISKHGHDDAHQGPAMPHKWMQGVASHMHKGALHRHLGIPEGHTIPASAMRRGAHSSSPTIRKEVALARTFKHAHHGHHHHHNKLLDHHAIERAKRKGHHRGYEHHHISKHGYDDAHNSSPHPRPYYDETGGGGRPFWSHHSGQRADHYGHPNAHPTDHHNNPHYAVHGHEPQVRDDHYDVGKGRFDKLTVPEHSRSVVASIPSMSNLHDRPDIAGGRRDRYGREYDHHELSRHDGGIKQENRPPPNMRKNMAVGKDDGYDGDTNLAVYAQHMYGRDNESRYGQRSDYYGRDRDMHELYRHERVHREFADTHHPNLAKPMSVGRDDGYDGTDGGPNSTYNQGIFDRQNRGSRGVGY